MLSINIPVYNIEVSNLVIQIKEQAEALSVDFDIRVYDDYSDENIKVRNRWLAEIPNIVYLELDTNIGRSAIRNKMGLDSTRRYQLFIDADSRLVTDKFLENYLKSASAGCVICGGTTYFDKKPDDTKKMLRWKYGQKREAVAARIRSDKKGFIITSNNFFIENDLFKKVHFREEINSYGHEDTFLGFDLFLYGAEILHIDNPVEHTGIEDSSVFLKKTRDGMKNLLLISKNTGTNTSDLTRKMSFLKAYGRLTKVVPPSMIKRIFKYLKRTLENHLTGKNPRLFIFDLYKLGYYAEISFENE